MGGKASRDKGHNYERLITNLFKQNGCLEAKRGLGQARSGFEVADVENTGYFIECKKQKNVNIKRDFKKAWEDSAKNNIWRDPILFSQDDYGQPLVIMHRDTFFELFKQSRKE